MRKPLIVFVVLSCLALPIQADLCTIDAVPAATLLLPYFEADIGDADGDGLADCDGITTVFSINNASPEPTLAHITFWTDWSFPAMNFDVFLTGFDVVHLDLCQAIGRGSLPVTADEQTDPDDLISPAGQPDWDGSFPFCDNIFPFPDPVISAALFDRIQNSHAGYPVPSLSNLCTGEPLNGDGSCSGGSCPEGTIARGYVTVDSVNQCSLIFPGEIGYFFENGTGIANNHNRLWGDVVRIDPQNPGVVAINSLVHIEADDSFDASSTPTNYTFWGRFTQSDNGADNREPLGTSWAVSYLDTSEDKTDFVVWRDSTTSDVGVNNGYSCDTGPDWRPLHETEVVCFDNAEDSVSLCSPDSDPPCFPLETQRLRVGEGALALPFKSGWCQLSLNIPDDSPSNDVDFPADPPGDIAQSWAEAWRSSGGHVTGGFPGIQLASACALSSPVVFEPAFYDDGFESGDTSSWSRVVP